MTNPIVSIVIPAYNAAEYIEDTIMSFIKQTYSHWEMIIINDGSVDSTSEIIHGFVERDSRITCVDQENQGGTAVARQKGISLASGKYLLCFDSDDIIFPDALDTLVNIAESFHSRVDIVSLPFYFWYQDGSRVRSATHDFTEIDGVGYFQRLLEERAYWALWSNFMRLDLIKRADFKISYDLSIGEDMVMLAQILDENTKILSCPEPLVLYRIRANSVSHCISDQFYRDFRQSMNLVDNILRNKAFYSRIRRSLYLAKLERCLTGFILGFDDTVEQDFRQARSYVLKYPSFWYYLYRKDRFKFWIMVKYFLLPGKAIAKARRTAETNRVL